MLEIIPIETSSLGDRSYLAHDGEIALVVDPRRDIDRVLALADQHRLRITHVLETHIHNDYVTGGLALAKTTGAAYHVNADDPVAFAGVPVRDGEAIQASDAIRVRVLATPGHTFAHIAYVRRSTASRWESSPAARCCTGRPDDPTCSGPGTPQP